LPRILKVQFEFVGEEGAGLGESPFWDGEDAVWWVDIERRKLLCTQLSTRRTISWPTPETPGFVVLTEPGRPAVGMESGIFLFDAAGARWDLLTAFEGESHRFNDATVDGTGRLWATTMAMDATPGAGALQLVTADMTLLTVLSGLTTPNGLAADMATGRLFISDSHPGVRTIWTAPCDFATGMLGPRAEFATMCVDAGRPDGAALGDDGRYWIAAVDGAAIRGFSGDGMADVVVPLSFPAPTKFAFLADGVAVTAKSEGGHDGRLAVATYASPPLRGPAIPFWRPGGR
jgi:sugar lactone lactonase YvrE